MELRVFVEEELFPAIWKDLNNLFPEMFFKFENGKWKSPKNLDGSDPTTRRKDKTIVSQKLYNVALENGGGGAKDLISLYMEHNNLRDRIEAIKEMASKCGLSIPEGTEAKKWEEVRERREQLALSYNRQKQALFSPEGAEVLRYLKEERGYSEELIRDMGLGYISTDEARTLEEKCKVGIAWKAEEYPLSIAYFSRGNVLGFKFRYTTPIEGKPKYMNTRSLGTEGMDSNPFGLTPQSLNLGDKKGEVVVVEGELDALHAIALGLNNVIAVAGGKITEGKAIALKKSGYKNIVILLDSDEAGQKYTSESIRIIDQVGLNSFVASLPGAKDTDEYLRSHSIGELKEVINRAVFGGAFLYIKERGKYLDTSQTDKDFFNFLEEYYKIASGYGDPVKREMLLSYLQKDFEGTDIVAISKAIQEKVELQAAIDEKKRKREQATSEIREASSLLANGEERRAASTLQKALQSLKEAEKDTEYSFLLKDNTDEIWRLYRENQVGLSSRISFTHEEGTEKVKYAFTFPSGAITIIGAPTGHGKSKLLQSAALDALEETKEGETLIYITYEENELNVNKQFLNAFANLYVKPKEKREDSSNFQVISKYLQSGNKEVLSKATREQFLKKEEEWKNIRRSRKIKIVKPDDNYLHTLLDIIDYSVKHLNIKAIFIDYLQEIYVKEWSKYSRSDELKEAMVQLDAMAQRTNLPIIGAAQLKRETNSPLDLHNQFIADSAWIERKASEIILVWSNKEGCKGDGADKAIKRIADGIEKELGSLELGTSGKLYAKLTKSRTIPSGSHTILPITGSTGRIGDLNKSNEQPKQGELFILKTTAPGQAAPPEKEADPSSNKPYRREESEEAIDDLPF